MAFFDLKIYSKVLNTSVSVYVTLPIPDPDDPILGLENRYLEPGEAYQTLYLLHGAFADHTYWLRYSNIERYAQAKKLAVVMPAAGNSFYTDAAYGENYFQFYTEELPMIMRSIFPLSAKREDNFIAGLSMGGYGAFYAALSKPENYMAAAALSGAIDHQPTREGIFQNVYGKNLERYDPKLHSLRSIALEKKQSGAELPKLYIACGTEDFIYDESVRMREYLREIGYDVTYEEGPGGHQWDFWDPYIRRVVENWLPLKGRIVEK